jgi:hypothetical protein
LGVRLTRGGYDFFDVPIQITNDEVELCNAQ